MKAIDMKGPSHTAVALILTPGGKWAGRIVWAYATSDSRGVTCDLTAWKIFGDYTEGNETGHATGWGYCKQSGSLADAASKILERLPKDRRKARKVRKLAEALARNHGGGMVPVSTAFEAAGYQLVHAL